MTVLMSMVLDLCIEALNLNYLLLEPGCVILGFGYFQNDDDDFFKGDLTPTDLFIFKDGFMQDELVTLRICLDYQLGVLCFGELDHAV